jgi:CBS domain-containing protein
MWWPALGALVLGVIGWWEPRVLGVGYGNIRGILGGNIVGESLVLLTVLKTTGWLIALGSGTAGGTMAPLFTIGGGAGSLLASGVILLFPSMGVDIRIGALVGMAAMFTGASRALLASVVFAFETTQQPLGLLPLLAGCTGAYLISLFGMESTIMTERLRRRGVPVITEYAADHLARITAREAAARGVISLPANERLSAIRAWLATGADGATHQGFPVVNEAGAVIGLVTRRDLTAPGTDPDTPVRRLIRRPPVVAFERHSLRDVADLMVHENVGRIPIVAEDGSGRLLGILSRSDLLAAHERRLDAARPAEPTIRLSFPSP